MLESLKSLWVSHQIANQAQFPQQTETLVGDWVREQKDFWWENELPIRQEYWKYVNFKDLSKQEFSFVPPAAKNNRVTHRSPQEIDIEINDLSQSSQWLVDSEFVKSLPQLLSAPQELQQWTHFIHRERPQNYFSAINRSFLFSGFAIRVPRDSELTINIAINVENANGAFLPFQFWLDAEMGCKVVIKESFKAATEEVFVLFDRLFAVAPSANVTCLQVENGHSLTHIIQNTDVAVAGDGQFDYLDITLPSHWSRHNVNIDLNGPAATTKLLGLYLNDQSYFSDHHTSIAHRAPHTHSYQYYKGILGGECRSVFNGRVTIAEGATGSNSSQLNKNLLLSAKAEIDTKPELQINNDDVKAAHGATIGQLDPEELFYLRSRGISLAEGWNVLCTAFACELFAEFPQIGTDYFRQQVEGVLIQMRNSHGL